MKKVTFPLKLNMQSPEVANLQDALKALLEERIILSADEAARQELLANLRPERIKESYGQVTSKLVGIFQGEQQLEQSGNVDEPTAKELNAILQKLGLLDQDGKDLQLAVSGQVRFAGGRPFKGGLVKAFHEAEKGSIRLGEDTTDVDGRYTILYQMLPGVASISLRVSLYDKDGSLLRSSEVLHNAGSLEIVDLTLPIAEEPPAVHRIEGRIVLENGLSAAGMTLRLYRRGFGQAQSKIAEISTGEFGQYILPFEKGGRSDSLEIRALVDGEEVSLSETLHDLGQGEKTVINLVAPESLKPLASEYQRLASDLAPFVGEMKNLADAKEDDERQDLTVLNRKTGWDARLIALASKAEGLSAEISKTPILVGPSAGQQVNIPQKALFGIFRAGLPIDKYQLALVSPDTVGRALEKARDKGIVDMSDDEVSQAKSQFAAFALNTRLATPAPGSTSTYGSLLQATGLDPEKQIKFAEVYLDHRGDAAELWDKAAAAGIEPDEIQTLQLQGKLTFLSRNSAAVARRLQKGLKISDPVQLVDNGLYQADRWIVELNAAAGIPPESGDSLTDEEKKLLDALIPASYEGESAIERRDAYAEDMARMVRLSYPTQVVGEMITRDDEDRFNLGQARSATAALLKNAADKGFRLGQTPVEVFIRDHPEVLKDLDAEDAKTVKQNAKILQRVYQITPDNDSIPILMELGLTSAYDVVAIPMEDFLDRFGHHFPSVEEARLVYRKAEQVSAVTYNLFTIAKKMDSEPPVPVISATLDVRKNVKRELIKRFPTLESLFGSLDFCECEHCRSVLSPAAYLVDLLQFLDIEDQIWMNNSPEFQAKYKRPYDALIDRRPDIPHIQLTCENTNTVLPYIDVVNEILEYYVANSKLEDEAAHDTGNTTSEELVAEPQNIVSEAYSELLNALYPLRLPFDLWLETVRQFCDYFEVPLWRLLEALRPGDELFVPGQAYDRSAIFIESLGLSPAEYAIFADPHPLDRWHELYGFASAAEATDESIDPETGQRIDLNSAKALSRRLGVTYKELVEILRTRFVNPGLRVLEILDKLDLRVTDVLHYRSRRDFFESNKDLLGKKREDLSTEDQERFDRLTLDDGWKDLAEIGGFVDRIEDLSLRFEPFGFDAKSWIEEGEESRFHHILVLSDPDSGCNFDETTVQYSGEDKADGIAFLKINLFVRLWRKLGWTIEETDSALQAFVPAEAPFEEGSLEEMPLKTALIYIAHLKALDERLHIGRNSRLRLLTLFSPIGKSGNNSLYSQIFLRRSMLKGDIAFDDPLGNYLSPQGLAALAESSWHDVSLEGVLPADKINPGDFAGVPRIALDYDELTQVQHLSYKGVLTDAEKAELLSLSPSAGLEKLLDAVQEKAREYPLVNGHLLSLQGALGLTADEIGRILEDGGRSIDAAELSLENVSLLYRYGLLAKALKLSVGELIALKQLSEFDPFKPLIAGPLTRLEQDHPFVQTLGFIETADLVKESGMKIEDIDYILRHHFDSAGKYRPKIEEKLALFKALSDGIRAIEAEYALTSDPQTIGEDDLRQKLGLALTPDVADRFLGMIKGTAEFTATRPNVLTSESLVASTLSGEPSIIQVSYNEARHEQKLTFRGVLFEERKIILKGKLPEPIPPDPFVPSPVLNDLFDQVQSLAQSFFENYIKKQPLKADDEAGFLDAEDFKRLFAPLEQATEDDTPEEIEEKQKKNEESLRLRRVRVAEAFLPFLRRRLIRQLIVQTMTARSDLPASLIEAMLTDARMLGGAEPRIEAMAALSKRGVDATFSDGAGAEIGSVVIPDADTSLKDDADSPIKPANTDRVLFEGYLEVQSPGAYRFYILLDRAGTEAEMRFYHLPESLIKGVAANNGAEINGYLELKPGILYGFSVEAMNLDGGDVRILVQGETLPKESLYQLALYPKTVVNRASRALTLLDKAVQIISELSLNEREVRYLLNHPEDFGVIDLGDLPADEADDTPERAKALFVQFLRLAGYARLKRDLAGGTDDIISIFEVEDLERAFSLLADLTRRDKATVRAAARAISPSPAFHDEIAIQRVWDALWVIERFGVSINSILGWTGIVSPSTTPDQRFAIAQDLRDAIKARFNPEMWYSVAQPIFDKLRQRQRDALVAHIMHKDGFSHPEQIYERFLIDPGMEPVVQTSRIRLAISSVQLFIQRCLLNLEQDVHPSSIDSGLWEWMKRYRMWEANRKIFLFPENWLEPEFRDDKTHLFKELEGNLLEGDVSDDLVEDAFLNYLKKLEELARLDIVGMHCEYNPDPAKTVLHVIGRTYSQPHKYFYRRYLQEMWEPWVPVTAEITGDHIAPVIWRDRLYVFWVTFLDKPDKSLFPGNSSNKAVSRTFKKMMMDSQDTGDVSTESEEDPGTEESPVSGSGGLNPPAEEGRAVDLTLSQIRAGMLSTIAYKQVEVQLHWTEYLHGEWSTPESGGPGASLSAPVHFGFDPREAFIHVSKRFEGLEERGVYIHLGGINQAFYLAGRNSTPQRATRESQPKMPYTQSGIMANRYFGNGHLTVKFAQRTTQEVGGVTVNAIETKDILGKVDGYILLPCDNAIALGDPEISSLVTPVFYQDGLQSTFFVEPSLEERTIEEWEEWVTPTPHPDPDWNLDDWWVNIDIKQSLPEPKTPVKADPSDPIWSTPIHPRSEFSVKPALDWITNPATVVQFGEELIGPAGRTGLLVLPAADAAEALVSRGTSIEINAVSDIPHSSTVIAKSTNAIEKSGLIYASGGLNIVGSGGLNSAMAKNIERINRSEARMALQRGLVKR